MWNIPNVVIPLTRRIFYDEIFYNFNRNRQVKYWLCTASNSSIALPDEINYPNANKKLKEYLENLKTNQSARKYENGTVLNHILQRYECRLSIVDQFKELNDEMTGENAEEIIALSIEEKQRFSKMLAEIDEEIIGEVIALNENVANVSSFMLEVQAGVGGQEAMLFARELFEMYKNYVIFKRWNHDILEEDNTDIGGLRSASIIVHGYNAYETLQYESGVHRVQRVPKTEKGSRIHTSTAVLSIIPCADEIKVILNPNELRIETKRSSGPGGQNANKLESAVRIVHIPTGIAVECQEERTQTLNKKIAMRKLHGKLYQVEFSKQCSSQSNMRKSQVGVRTRNEKLRTYNYAQNRITDHRVNGASGTVHNLDEFLMGTEHFNDFIHKVQKILLRQKLNAILDGK